MRLAFFGGSFDPFHNGHFAIVQALHSRDLCDEVLCAPAAVSPGKIVSRVPGFHRLEMARRAVVSLDHVTVTDMDLHRCGPSYTVDTLSILQRNRPYDELILVIGGDAWRDFDSWREPDRILNLAQIIVFPRGDGNVHRVERGGDVQFIEDFAEPVSSTDIRLRLATGGDLTDLVPPPVMRYIRLHGLYGNGTHV